MENEGEISKRIKYQGLIAQINYLRSPARKDGPSIYEAEDAIIALEKEADRLSEELFYISAGKKNKARK